MIFMRDLNGTPGRPVKLSHFRNVVLILAALLPGCGSNSKPGQLPVYRATGLVTFKDEPLEGARVFFHSNSPFTKPDGKPVVVPIPVASTKDDGTFVVTTYQPGDGLPAGDYRVTISCSDLNGKPILDKNGQPIRDEFPELLPSKYQDPAKSGIEASVEKGGNPSPLFFAFDLTP